VDTIQHLRKQVGQASLLMAGAAAIIVDEQDRLRLLKRSESGCWDPLEWRASRLGLVLSR